MAAMYHGSEAKHCNRFTWFGMDGSERRRGSHRRPPVAIILLCAFVLMSYGLLYNPIRTRQPPSVPKQNWPPVRPVSLNINEAIESTSNLAATYLFDWRQNHHKWNGTMHPSVSYCRQIGPPLMLSMKHNNVHWQMLEHGPNNLTHYLFNAYYDNRSEPMVRVLASSDAQSPVSESVSLGCLLWFDGQRYPAVGRLTEVYSIWPSYWSRKPYEPQLVSCALPVWYAQRGDVPRAISLTTGSAADGCNRSAQNMLRVLFDTDRGDLSPELPAGRRNIGVCVHAIRFATYDFSIRLVEWLEMVRLMGAAKVYFYVLDANENIYRILNHYARTGLVRWRSLKLPGWQPNIPGLFSLFYEKKKNWFRPQELIELNDCLYSNLYRHDYLAVFDVDEMLMPQKAFRDWSAVLDAAEATAKAKRPPAAYFLHRHALVYEQFEENKLTDGQPIPSFMYMMRHTYREPVYTNAANIKCFHRTSSVLALHNHFPLRCLRSRLSRRKWHNCWGRSLHPAREAMLLHYRLGRPLPAQCINGTETEQQQRDRCAIHDRNAWRWYRDLEPRVRSTLTELFGTSDPIQLTP